MTPATDLVGRVVDVTYYESRAGGRLHVRAVLAAVGTDGRLYLRTPNRAVHVDPGRIVDVHAAA